MYCPSGVLTWLTYTINWQTQPTVFNQLKAGSQHVELTIKETNSITQLQECLFVS